MMVINAPLTPPKYNPKSLPGHQLISLARYIANSRALFFLL
jgi:hypothetical protein